MKLRIPSLRFSAAFLLCCLVFSPTVFAQDNTDYTQFGHNINVGPGKQISEATCFGCTIRVRGQVAGDVTTFGGSIILEDQGQIGGDVTAFAGDIRLGAATNIGGDVAVFGGQIRRDPAATVGGSVTSMSGMFWVILIFVGPFVLLGFLIASIVWLVKRARRPAVPLAA